MTPEQTARRDYLVGLIAKLEKMRASGVKRATHEGRTIEYQSVAEMTATLAVLRAELAALVALDSGLIKRPRIRTVYPVTDRGGFW